MKETLNQSVCNHRIESSSLDVRRRYDYVKKDTSIEQAVIGVSSSSASSRRRRNIETAISQCDIITSCFAGLCWQTTYQFLRCRPLTRMGRTALVAGFPRRTGWTRLQSSCAFGATAWTSRCPPFCFWPRSCAGHQVGARSMLTSHGTEWTCCWCPQQFLKEFNFSHVLLLKMNGFVSSSANYRCDPKIKPWICGSRVVFT